jgi:nicotinate-nucleotide adenylyltransferase
MIVEMADLLVYKRPGSAEFDLPDWLEPRVSLADAPLIDVSGTDIRRRRALGQTIRYLVPAPVEAIIEEQGLYR